MVIWRLKWCIIFMYIIVIIIRRYVISCIDIMNRCDIRFFFCINWIDSIFLICMVNYLWCILMRWNLFTYIVFFRFFVVNTNTWLCICYFFKIVDCIKRTLILNIVMRKVWSFYKIINVWCIQIIWFVAIDMWDNGIKSSLLRLVQKVSILFNSIYFYFKIRASVQSQFTLKIDETFHAMSIKHRLAKRKI